MSEEELKEVSSKEDAETSYDTGVNTDTSNDIKNDSKELENLFVPETIEARYDDHEIKDKRKIVGLIPSQHGTGGSENEHIWTTETATSATAAHIMNTHGDLNDTKLVDAEQIDRDGSETLVGETVEEVFCNSGIAEIKETKEYVVCDYERKVVRILNSDYRTVAQCHCVFQPWDVAVVEPSILIVSFPFVRLLQLFKVRHKTQLVPWHPLISGNEYYGIVYERSHVIATCLYDNSGTGPCVHVMNKEGVIQRKISENRDGINLFVEPMHIAVDENTHMLYVLDQGNQSLVRFTREGEGLCVVKQLSEYPSGLTVDSARRTVMVGDRSTRSVLVLNDTLKVVRVVKARDDEMWTPLALMWCERSARLLATTETSPILRALQI